MTLNNDDETVFGLDEVVEDDSTTGDITLSKEDKEDKIAKVLTQLQANQTENIGLAKLLADPDVRAVLDAKQQGKKLKLVSAEEASPQVEKIEEPDWESVDNKGMADYILKSVANMTKNMVTSTASEMIQEQLKPLMGRLNAVDGYVVETQKNTIQQQIKDMRAQFKDFDEFQKDMLELNQVAPGLSLKELYQVAKNRKQGFEETPSNIRTERPTNQPRPSVRVARKTPLPNGRGGFDQSLAEALENLEI